VALVAARIDGDVRQVVGGLRVVGSTATTSMRSAAREAKMASLMMNTFSMSTQRATIMAKALNVVMLAGAFGTMTLGIGGAALALLSFAGNSAQAQKSVVDNSDEIGILNERLSTLKRELGLTQEETDENTDAFDDLAEDGANNAIEFADAMEQLIMSSTTLTEEQKQNLLGIVGGIRAGAQDILDIYAKAASEHRPINDEERQMIEDLWNDTDEAMYGVKGAVNGAYSGPDGVFGTFDDAVNWMSPEGKLVQAVLGLAGEHDELDGSIDRIVTNLRDNLFPLLEEKTAEIYEIEVRIKWLEEETAYTHTPWSRPPGVTYEDWRALSPPTLSGGKMSDLTPQWWDDFVGGIGNLFGDVVWRPGEAPIGIDPDDTVMAFKEGGGAGANGGQSITINVTGNTIRSDADIDELVRRISAELRDRTGRRI
jgi:hypothetical protein